MRPHQQVSRILKYKFARNSLSIPRVSFSSEKLDESQYFLWPNETEGNMINVNFSLTDEGIINRTNAYRNARLPLLTNRLESKVVEGAITLKKPLYFGAFELAESGDSISHDIFDEVLTATRSYLSSGLDLFVEDASLCAFSKYRVGVRITTDQPAIALLARKLLIRSPPREVDHRARFDCWRTDPRWKVGRAKWNGQHYDLQNFPHDGPLKGQRPIVAFVGGDTHAVAVQFVENSSKEIIGANVVIGEEAPVRGIVSAIGHAASVYINEKQKDAVAIPAVTLVKGKETVIIVGGDDSIVDAAAQSINGSSLFDAYHCVLSAPGVSALWNGYIGNIPSKTDPASLVPSVHVNGKTVVPIVPHNLAFPPTQILFYQKGAKKSVLSLEDAVKKIVELSDSSKEGLINSLLSGVKLSVIGKSSDISI
eukprot:gene5163-7188_t